MNLQVKPTLIIIGTLLIGIVLGALMSGTLADRRYQRIRSMMGPDRFPEQLVEGIRLHHDPLAADEEYRDAVAIVYLANCFYYLDEGTYTFDQVEPTILRRYELESEEEVRKMIEEFRTGFDEEIVQGA